ncbi:hypothetical protein, partial [Desulfococcus sp.]|uniref:beta-xylosidase family glycoside hydrolase n=1 Tax=Desulfococcus sp. TaxID=2025834 RepID=UPI003593C9A8
PTQNTQQAGLLVYQDDDNYVQVTRIYAGGSKVTLAREVGGSAVVVNSISETSTQGIHLRLDRELSTDRITAHYSLDGANWISPGSVVQSLNNPRLAIFAGASPGGFPNAILEWAEVITDESSAG